MDNNILLRRIFDLFRAFEIYLVGGSVRDRLLNVETSDFDFATNASPEQTKKILEDAGYKAHTIGIAFGTVSVMDDGYKVEVTTYRKDEDYVRDNRNPKVEWGATISEDLARRDFTINAIAQDRNNNIIDPYHGVEHLNQKLLDTPIDANRSFEDDPLRLLRAVRFKARYGFSYSEQVQNALYKQAYRLLILPRERILDELNKILMTDNPAEALEDLHQFRLLDYIIPELTILSKIDQTSTYHSKNVWVHTVNVLRNIPHDLVLRWAAIMHDLGKISTYSVENGNVHFFHHEEISAMLTYTILYRLGMSKQMTKDITYLVRNHMRANTYDKSWSDASIRRFIRDTGEYCDKLLALSRADITSHNLNTVALHLSDLENLEQRIEEQRNFKEAPKCPIGGLAIMDFFELTPCHKVGEIKDLILNAIISGDLKQDASETDMLKYAKNKMEIRNE